MENKVSEILENILGLLSLEGTFELEEKEEAFFAYIETEEAGKLIGKHGDTLTALQLLVNQILAKLIVASEDLVFKKVVIDVSDWKKGREEELAHKARQWASEVIETSEAKALLPMSSWERRVVHLTIQNTEGVSSESEGLGADRHIVIKPSIDEKITNKPADKN